MSYFRKIRKRIGHRGAFLALIAITFILYGFGLYYEPVSLRHTDFFLSFQWWPAIFWMSGSLILIWRFIYPATVALSFGLASFVSTWWAIRWLHVWIVENGTAGWSTAFTWTFVSLLILMVSTWPEITRGRRCKEWMDDDEEC